MMTTMIDRYVTAHPKETTIWDNDESQTWSYVYTLEVERQFPDGAHFITPHTADSVKDDF